MSPRSRRLLPPLVVGAVTLLAVGYVGLVDPNQPGHYPLCPTKALTGLDCPGCGGLRAVHSLAHLDLVGAADHNAFVTFVLLPVAVVAWVAWLVRAWRGPGAADGSPRAASPAERLAAAVARPSVVWSIVALLVVFTVVRNVGGVPAFAWLGSGVA